MKINGFTLLEMLLVLTISFTLITLTIFPISSTLSTLREKQLLEEIKASIYYAQINAVATNQDTFISFDPTKINSSHILTQKHLLSFHFHRR